MATYFQHVSGSEIQGSDSLTHKLFLMNPNHKLVPSIISYSDTSTTTSTTTHRQQPATAAAAATTAVGLIDLPPPPRGPLLSLSGENHGGDGGFPAHQYVSVAYSGGIIGNVYESSGHLVLGSKYLRALQEILDEVVDVRSAAAVARKTADGAKEKAAESAAVGPTAAEAIVGSSKQGVDELSIAQRQELQVKKAKLASMLDEVEQRYRQYHHQMQIVISSFEQAAGFGSAKSYTALALKTISKQFRSLKDVISAQVKAASKGLGEEECLAAKIEGSRLRYVDHRLHQQRTLQQLGMMQHSNNVWRPQRGLPEHAVTILRAWLFEHFLHPYPKMSDKIVLAKQTGLTRSQVSNWFINARVRLWKPMIEEMYMEETKEKEPKTTSIQSDHNTHNHTDEPNEEVSPSPSPSAHYLASTSQVQEVNSLQYPKPSDDHRNFMVMNQNCFPMIDETDIPKEGFNNIIGSSAMEIQGSPKKQRSKVLNSPSSTLSMDMEMKRASERNGRDVISNNQVKSQSSAYSVGFGSYLVGDYPHHQLDSRFHGNGVSLTLGLPHCENSSVSNQNVISPLGLTEEMSDYESMDMQRRKSFVAPQLFPDFVD